MYKGQIMVYKYNGLHNSNKSDNRNVYTIKNINVVTKEEFQQSIENALDEVLPGKGYALVKWNQRLFICEKDINNPEIDYIRHEISYHPLINEFTT